MEPGAASTWPRSTSSRLVPRSSTPTFSPARPSSSSLRNISTPVQVVFEVSRMPTISISSPTFTTPRSTRPVTTVPRPEMENTSSMGMRKGFSTSRFGSGMYSSRVATSFSTAGTPLSAESPSRAFSAEPVMMGVSSPGKSYWLSSSRISISTSSSSSSSSTMSDLFMNTTM